MVANIQWYKVSDDSEVTATHTLTPAILYRGMSTYQEYSELYAKNTGTAALTNPSYTMTKVTASAIVLSRSNRMISTDVSGTTQKIAWDASDSGAGDPWDSAANYVLFGPTIIQGTAMATGAIFYIHTRHKIGSAEVLGTVQFKHTIGGV